MPLLRMAVAAVIAFGLDRLSKIVIVHWLDLSSVAIGVAVGGALGNALDRVIYGAVANT